MPDTVPLFRAPMRSRDDTVPDGVAVERALNLNLVGVGGRLESAPSNLDEATHVLATEHGERLARRLERFAVAPDGAYVWTRDIDGFCWLGRVAGSWRYDDRPEAFAVDLVHVRPCVWLAEPVAAAEIPAAVAETFSRGGRNWQRIRSLEGLSQTQRLWELRTP